jgi:hypothetical protein
MIPSCKKKRFSAVSSVKRIPKLKIIERDGKFSVETRTETLNCVAKAAESLQILPIKVKLKRKQKSPCRTSFRASVGKTCDMNNGSTPKAIPNVKPRSPQKQRSPKKVVPSIPVDDLEKLGQVTFTVVANDNTPTSLILLTKLKRVIQTQLKYMPREYVTRIVYDLSHTSIVIAQGGQILGGAVFKHFDEQKFTELTFLCIAESYRRFVSRC